MAATKYGSQLMMDEDGPYGEVLLTVHMALPDDYVVTAAALPVEFIFNDVPHHKRILVRMSFVFSGGFYPVTLVADTCAPSSFYLVSPHQHLSPRRAPQTYCPISAVE